MVAHMATKERFEVGQLTPKQQEIMYAAQGIQQRNGAVTIEGLVKAVPGSTIQQMNLSVAALKKKGCWIYNERGRLLPAGDIPCILVWPDEDQTGTGTGTGTGTTNRSGTRPAKPSGATGKQARVDFCTVVNQAFQQLPHDDQIDFWPHVKAMTDTVMGT